MTDRFFSALLGTAIVAVFLAAIFAALTACSPGSGDNAPEVVDAGDLGPSGAATSPTFLTSTPRQLAVQLCRGECLLKRAAGCDTLDSAYELGFCQGSCDGAVAAIQDRCLDEYIGLRSCVAGSAAPVYVCTTSATTSPILRDAYHCNPEALALAACRAF